MKNPDTLLKSDYYGVALTDDDEQFNEETQELLPQQQPKSSSNDCNNKFHEQEVSPCTEVITKRSKVSPSFI